MGLLREACGYKHLRNLNAAVSSSWQLRSVAELCDILSGGTQIHVVDDSHSRRMTDLKPCSARS
jgi:hypothetical protein